MSKPFNLELLSKKHDRQSFSSGQAEVDQWLKTSARQAQEKRLSSTRVLVDDKQIIGYFTLAQAWVPHDLLAHELSYKLPSNPAPVINLAWLGVDENFQGNGLGGKLLVKALSIAYQTGLQIPFIAVIIDCLDKETKAFYKQFNFKDVPGYSMKLYLSWSQLDLLMKELFGE